MLDNKVQPAHLIRVYLWDLLKNNIPTLTTIPGKNGVALIPIIPINDEPDLADSGKTYMIYGYSETESRNIAQGMGIFSLRIVAQTFAEMGNIQRVIANAFEIEDTAAENVNLWTTYKGYGGIRFLTACITYMQSGDPSVTEGGPIEGIINIRYRYVTHQASKIFDGIGWSDESQRYLVSDDGVIISVADTP